MSRQRLIRMAPAVSLSTLLGACAADGPIYRDLAAEMPTLASDQARIVFMRPRDRDDAMNGGRAIIRVDGNEVGGLAYGGFFYTDLAAGPHTLTASGHYVAFGRCDLQFQANGGDMVYVDIGPRTSYMVASLVGSLVGGVLGAAAGPDVVIAPGEQVLVNSGTAAMAAGSLAGDAAGQLAAGPASPCGGPYRLDLLAEDQALGRLEALTLSQ